MVGIYKIVNNINGKAYIGQSINIAKRWNAHKNSSFNSNSSVYETKIARAFRKYGIDNFSFEIIEECELDKLNEKEIFYIQQYDSVDNGYNISLGGQHSHPQKLTFSDAEEIINLLINSSQTQQEIAEQYNVSQIAISDINIGDSWRKSGIEYPIRERYQKEEVKSVFCQECGIELAYKSRSLICHSCAAKKTRKVERPDRETLKFLIREKSFCELGRIYHVSDNSIKKWCKSYSLPHLKSQIKAISNEDWNNI